MFSFLCISEWKAPVGITLLLMLSLVSLTTYADDPNELHAPELFSDKTETVARIAILSFRHKDVTIKRWQPLIDYLNAEIPNVKFEQHAYTNREMDEAVALGQVDFVFVQPSHYVLLTYSHGLSSPLATLVNTQNGVPVSMFGGVIFTRADRSDIESFDDLRGKTVATPDISGLGGFQMQAYELHKNGLRAFKDYQVIETDQPQDRVIDAVVNGIADFGFVRTGLLESMIDSGALNFGMMKILEPRNEQGFPFPSSTALYP